MDRERVRLFVHEVAYYTMLGAFDELQNVVDFIAHRYLLGYLDNGVLQAEVAGIDNAVAVADVSEYALGVAFVTQNNGVYAMVGGGVATEYDVGRHVFLHAAAALHQREAAYTNTLLEQDAIALDGAVFDDTFAGHAGANAQHALVANGDVVADVHLVHDVVAATNTGGAFGVGAAGNDNVLANAVVIADNDVCRRAVNIVEVLRGSTHHSVLTDDIVLPHGGSFQDGRMRLDYAVVADDDALFDIGEGGHLDVLAQLSLGVNVC